MLSGARWGVVVGVIVAFLLAVALLVIVLIRRRRRLGRLQHVEQHQQQHQQQQQPQQRAWSFSQRLFGHKRNPSDASRLLPLLASESSHDGRMMAFAHAHAAYQQQPYGQADDFQPYAHHAVEPTPLLPDPTLEFSSSPPTMTQVETQRLNVDLPSIPSELSPATGSIRQLPPLPLPAPSELHFQLSKHLPALFIPSTPYPNSPLASTARLTPGPGSSNYHGIQSPDDDSSPSVYSHTGVTGGDGSPDAGESPSLTQGYNQALSRLNTISISQLLQSRARAIRQVPSRASTRSSSVTGRQNSNLSAVSTVDIEDNVTMEGDGLQKTPPPPTSFPGPRPSRSIDSVTEQAKSPRSGSRSRGKRRLLPPTPFVPPPEWQVRRPASPMTSGTPGQLSSHRSTVQTAEPNTPRRAGQAEPRGPRPTARARAPLPTIPTRPTGESRGWRALPPIVQQS